MPKGNDDSTLTLADVDAANDRPCKDTVLKIAPGIFTCLLDIGEAMLDCGADVHTVEQTLARLGLKYGAVRMNVLVITAVIVVTANFPDGKEKTFTRRVLGDGNTDFAKLEMLTSLCKECEREPLELPDLQKRLAEIRKRRFPNYALFIGGLLSAGGFAMFFDGSIADGVASAIFALLVCLAIRWIRPVMPNIMAFNFVISTIVGILICLVVGNIPDVDVDAVIIGVIMLLIPGVAMTNATRDMFSGDTISGVMRFIESLLWATGLALGFMAALWLCGSAGWMHSENAAQIDWPFLAMIVITAVASAGFALYFDVPNRFVALATLGGVITWMVYFALDALSCGIFVSCVIASTLAATFSEVVARHFKVPPSIFLIISVIPLVPGRMLYFTAYNAASGNWDLCGQFAVSTLLFAAGIAAGICLVSAAAQVWESCSARLDEHAKS